MAIPMIVAKDRNNDVSASQRGRSVQPKQFGTGTKRHIQPRSHSVGALSVFYSWLPVLLAHVATVILLMVGGHIEIRPIQPFLIAILSLDIFMLLFPIMVQTLRWTAIWLTRAIAAIVVGASTMLLAYALTIATANMGAGSLLIAIFGLAANLAVIASITSGNKIQLIVATIATALTIAFALTSLELAIWTGVFGLIILVVLNTHRSKLQKAKDIQKEKRDYYALAVALVNDYEDSGRGWFWLTDRDGKIRYISDCVTQSLEAPDKPIIGRALTTLVAPSKTEDNAAERTLSFHMTARTAFNDLVVRLAEGEGERLWSISGTPLFNDLGQFKGYRGHGTDLTEVRRSQDAVVHAARYDNLTGLANRLYIREIFEKAIINHRNQPVPCAIFMLDLDRFKQVNDTLGHAAGDILLKQVSERLTRTIGERGQVGRLGGDEFLVVLPGVVTEEKLADLAKLVIANLSHPYMVEGNQIVIGASVGVVLNEAKTYVTAETMMRNGDLALYSAKENGRGTYRFFHDNMHDIAKERSRLEEDLRHALATGGLSLAYQAVVNVATSEIAGFEVLARWNHPTLGPISPGQFIPIAEEAGLIMQLGEWVLRTACADAAGWSKQVRVAVNVSPIQFADPGFPAVVLNTLAQSGLTPDLLELEITENVFLDDHSNIDDIFSRLKGLGVRLALDDFGTGYSALGYLRKAPVDKIKIDQSFVRGAVAENGPNRAIIRSIVVLAEALNMETTAEGAETVDELELVRTLGCSHVQGYVYGKPMPPENVSKALAEHGGKAVAIGFRSSRAPRRKVMRTIGVIHDDFCYRAKIKNLSDKGALIEGLWDVPPGTSFEFLISDDWEIKATCRWSDGDKMGVEFSEPITFEELRKAPPLTVIQGPVMPAEVTRVAGL